MSKYLHTRSWHVPIFLLGLFSASHVFAQEAVEAEAEENKICPIGQACQPKPNCVEEGIPEHECEAFDEPRKRGRMQDRNKVLNAAWFSDLPKDGERLLPDETFTLWMMDEETFQPNGEDQVVYQNKIVEDIQTIKLDDLVPAIRFKSGNSDIPEEYVTKLREVLRKMDGRKNVRLNFVGHTDNDPLGPKSRAKYGDNVGLSKARAAMTAEYFQKALGLSATAVTFDGKGETKPIAANNSNRNKALNRRVEVEVWYDEITQEEVQEEVVVKAPEMTRMKVCRVIERCIYKRKVGKYKKVQIKNAMPPVRYSSSRPNLPAGYIQQLRGVLREYQGKPNIILKIVGHTDNQLLTGANARIYGDNNAYSVAIAQRIMQGIKDELELNNDQIMFDGKGDGAPIASNASASGRALNRRVEVEIWHDDPRGGHVSEPLACPGDVEAEMIATHYEGAIPMVPFKDGQPKYPVGFAKTLQRLMDKLADKANVRFNFVGHTTNERLSRRAAIVYGTHKGISESRARRVMEYVQSELGLDDEAVMYEGRGFVEPLANKKNNPFARRIFSLSGASKINPNVAVRAQDARVEIEVIYDELAVLEEDPNLEIIRIKREEPPVSPYSLQPIRISVDGKTIDDSRLHTADVQRCTDVALEQANVQLQYDNLDITPRLNIHAFPSTVTYEDDPETPISENSITFKTYTNYRTFIKRGEVRVFNRDQSLQTEPLAIVPLNDDLTAEWWLIPEVKLFEGPIRELKYVLRVYDEKQRFDETAPKRLWVVNKNKPAEDPNSVIPEEEALVGYGESHLAIHNIPLQGGKVTVNGTDIPLGHSVWLLNNEVPVSPNGQFVSEQIIPDGLHTLEVAVLDEEGNGELYLRDMQFKTKDWFIVGLADLTLGVDDTNGPAALVTGDTHHYESDFWADGRLAFYAKGKTKKNYKITASADTREEPLDDLFSNFTDKDPDAVFRRLDPDYFYPTYGDDSTTIEDAPTSGKFYVKAEKNKSFGLWGNFETKLLDTDLAQVDRVLYGAQYHLESLETTQYGESRMQVDLFAAEPGTVQAREEFRGTGGSLFFLSRRDLTIGSERLRIEVRDKDSGVVLHVTNLVPAEDYDIDYIQGRVLLTEPLSSTADDNVLIQDGSLDGNPIFLVTRYEYTPGFESIDDVATGGRVARWLGDYVQLGATVSNQEQIGSEQELFGVDFTLRKTPGSYIRLEKSSTTGPSGTELFSDDGGFAFNSLQAADSNQTAGAFRLEGAMNINDFFAKGRGKATFYWQDREAGFAAPSQLTNTDVTQMGATVIMPIKNKLELLTKYDVHDRDQGLETTALEVNTKLKVNEHWQFTTGLRMDTRDDNSVVVPDTQTQGDRTDIAFEAAYDTRGAWSAYTFAQTTVQATGTREDNNRMGAGGSYQITDRWRGDAEISFGDGGTGGRLGTDYLVTDRTNVYLAYGIDHERSDTGERGRNGRTTVGFRLRFNDTLSVYGEERYSFGDQPTGLTHAYGVDLTPTDRWTLGMSLETGTLRDDVTSAETERTAYGFNSTFNAEKFKYGGAFELREDSTEVSDRETYLLKNTVSYQTNPNWRLLGKLNLSESTSSLGEFYDGNFTEMVLGYGYRPIKHDRLNMLFKYTFFENLPAPEQESIANTRADFIQRSTILSADVTYDLSKRWSLGAKYAFRNGEVALEREDPEFFDSNATLVILRADWHVVRHWDMLVEARSLNVEQAEDTRSGMLFAIYRHLGKNIKIGTGYNFTDFSDDLTDLSFDSQGAFFNIIGKL